MLSSSESLKAALVAVSLLASGARAATPASARRDVSTLSKAQIAALGDDDEVIVRGEATTKRKMKARLDGLRQELDAKIRQAAPEGASRFQNFADSVHLAQKTKLELGNQKYEQGRGALQAVAPPCTYPTIKSILNNVVSPGMPILVLGCGFGKHKGEIVLTGQFPGGELKLERVEWHEGGVGGFVPHVTKVREQDARLVVRKNAQDAADAEKEKMKEQVAAAMAAQGHPPPPPKPPGQDETQAMIEAQKAKKEAEEKQKAQIAAQMAADAEKYKRTLTSWPIRFEPLLEARNLKSSEVRNYCSGQADVDDCSPVWGHTFDASHSNGIDISDDTGHDSVKVSLKNGWKADSYYLRTFGVGLGTPGVHDPTGFSKTASSFEMGLHWWVPAATILGYFVNVHASGPAGFSPTD